MLALVSILLVIVLIGSRKIRGPLWALSIGWLIAIVPLATKIVEFSYLAVDDWYHAALLFVYILCFVIGACLFETIHSPRYVAKKHILVEERDDFLHTLATARICWLIGLLGTLLLCIDFFFMEGVGLNDLAALRETYTDRRVTLFAQIASVMTWGCLYSFVFALLFKSQMTRVQFYIFLIPVVGYFLVAVFSAGRQTAFQIAIFAILTLMIERKRDKTRRKRISGNTLLVSAVAVAMVGYMGYVASARNDALVSSDKVEVLERLFSMQVASWFNWILLVCGESVRTTTIEALVYFSSPTALFAEFLTIPWDKHFFGAMSFPFIFRQLEGLTGLSVIDSLSFKVGTMNDAGVIGAGWTTAFSIFILDFGFVFAGFVLFLIGYYSAYTWRMAKIRRTFNRRLVALVMLCGALYLPMLPISSDTNLLLLWLFCMLATYLQERRKVRMRFNSFRNASV